MCDLIDLDNSTCSSVNSKLLSPLIPAPSNIDRNNVNVPNDKDTLTVNGRESLGNNPFDMVLHEAIEYVRKKEDPFEIVIEKTLEKDKTIILDNKNTNVTDDLKATYTEFLQKLKEGKTLDESFANPDFVKPTVEVKSMNSSILNQSAMNDTLSEINCGIEKNEIKCTIQQKIPLYTQTVENNIESTSIDIKSVPHKYLRSYSQGDMKQECKQCLKHRSNSAVETLKTDKISISDPDSLFSIDSLNKGFLQDQYNDNSVFSTLSNVSNISRLTPNSLAYNSVLSTISNNTMNRAFLNSCASEVSCDAKLNGSVNNIMNTVSINSETLPSFQKQIDTSDLVQKLNDVEMKLSKSQVLHTVNTDNVCLSEQILNNTVPYLKNTSIKTTFDVDSKLLDTNTCIPEIILSKPSSDDTSNCGSFENSKLNKSILDEAKVLARTFEELAQRPSGSSLDDININDLTWPPDLLPAFEDEIVDDLIELPSLPNVKKEDGGINDVLSHQNSTKNNCDNIKLQNNITKEIEVSHFSPIVADKTIASTLLLDLKKVVKAENNFEANKLLENLEKVLGIRSNKNMELLSACLQTNSDPSKNQEDNGIRSEIIKNIEHEKYINKNHVDDFEIHKIKINEDLCHSDKMNNNEKNEVFNESNKLAIMESEVKNNQPLMNEHLETSLKEEKSSIHVEKKEKNVDVIHSTHVNISENEKENDETETNEKVAVELLINLGKVLSGQSEKSATLNLLKNLGEVLNLVSKNKQEKSTEQDDAPCTNNESIVVKDKLKTGKKVQSLMSSKLKHRQSLDLISQVEAPDEKTFKSMCAAGTAPNKTPQSTLAFKTNSRSQLKRISKRFPSDPGFISLASCKNGVTASTGDIRQEIITRKDIQQVNNKEQASIRLVVKNQLKSKTKSEIVNKKGPMKAVIPIGNMQRRGIITPPKSPRNVSIKIRSSTPNSTGKGSALKKSKSKPIASSTPDTPKRKSVLQLPVLQRCDKLNISCDISPINVQEEAITDKCGVYSPKKTSGCPSPRRVTPKNQLKESSIPKYSISPGVRARQSSYDMNKSGQSLESSQVSFKREENVYKKSPVICKRIGTSQQKSPLKDSNKIIIKTKPLNLTSKLRRNDNGNIGSEKENAVS